jgi:hypothetical protein
MRAFDPRDRNTIKSTVFVRRRATTGAHAFGDVREAAARFDFP